MGKHARRVVVALHVVSSVGWMSQAVALLALLLASATAEPGLVKEYAAWAAEYLDAHVLAFAANTSAFTGLLLAAATPWGLVRHWWVATKLVLTVGQVYAGIAVLSVALRDTAAAAVVGQDGPVWSVVVGTGLMASALGFQTWLSVAKPWGRTPVGQGRGTTAPAAVFVAGAVAPVVDIAIGTALLGSPTPALSLAVLVVVLARPWERRASAQRPSVSSSRP